MLIIGPNVAQPAMEIPSPSEADCTTLLTYADRLVNKLETVISTLNDVSQAPDDGLISIRQQAEDMLAEAKSMRGKLEEIKSSATSGGVYF